jgi:hypothetical protein
MKDEWEKGKCRTRMNLGKVMKGRWNGVKE